MQLKVKIHNKEFESHLVQGCTFTEEYTETLDSGSIILAQIPKIKNLQPYDDVYIYDGIFEGFDDNGNIIGDCKFYKHMLVDQFSEERLNLKSNIYTYRIQLFSETKGLETIQLPNISITQPLNIEKKISIYDYMKQFINMYSPKIKVVTDVDNQIWEYKTKYKLSEQWVDLLDDGEYDRKTMHDIFAHSYTPDFTLNTPNLRDVLAKLMIVKDRIPVVYNNVIYALDITKRRGKFNFDKGQINFITSSNSSSNYADNLRRTYSDALSQDRTCKMVEYLGFRNRDTALMKLSDLRIETSFPIYKINKIYMCYYKKIEVTSIKDFSKKNRAFLCKQDITPLVKLNSERNLLSQDWDDFDEGLQAINTKDFSKYKMATIGYDIGSNHISGWGEKYGYTKGWWKTEKTYIENVFTILDSLNYFGIYTKKYLYESKILDADKEEVVNIPSNFEDRMVKALDNVVSPYSNNSLKLKGFFFEIDYDAFYSGSVIHTKDLANGDITMNDNSGSSLTLLEMDGLSQKEKINRFGNKGYTIPARYTDYSEIQGLGYYYDDDENDTDIIIYRKEYSINGNVINCTYSGMKDYVLKNYFTSVYAKHRPYNLMSYGESVTRAENKKVIFLFSKRKKYYEKQANIIFNYDHYIDDLFSFCSISKTPKSINNFINEKQINYGYLEINSPIYTKDENGIEIIDEYVQTKYASDLNAFVNGNSMCFNMTMTDNVSMGVYVKDAMPFENNENFNPLKDFTDPKDDYTGTLQTWYMTTDDIETGFAKEIGFYVGHNERKETFLPINVDLSEEDAVYFGKTFSNLDKEHSKIKTENIVFKTNEDGEIIGGINYLYLIGGYIDIDLTYKDKLLINTYINNVSYSLYKVINEQEELIETIIDTNKYSYISQEINGEKIRLRPTVPTIENSLENRFFSLKIKNEFSYTIDAIYDSKLFTLPKINENNFNLTNVIGSKFEVNKDNKEIINMTYQIEPITDDDNIMFSPWMMKLSDLIGNYNKFEEDKNINDSSLSINSIPLNCSMVQLEYSDGQSGGVNEPEKEVLPMMTLVLKKENLEKLNKGDKLGNEKIIYNVPVKDFGFMTEGGWGKSYDVYYEFIPKEIEEIKYIDENNNEFEQYADGLTLYYIKIKGNQIVKRKKAFSSSETEPYEDENVILKLENVKISSQYYDKEENIHPEYKDMQGAKLIWHNIPEDEFYLSNIRFSEYYTIFNTLSSGFAELIEPITFDNGKKTFGINGYVVGNGLLKFNPWEQEKDINKKYFTTENSENIFLPLDGEMDEDSNYIYPRNMFVVLDEKPLKKNLVYEEYKCLQENEVIGLLDNGKRKDFLTLIQNNLNIKPGYNLSIEYEKNVPYLSIVLPTIYENDQDGNLKKKQYNSVQLWYLDNIENGVEPDISKASYKFVFGVNVTDEEREKNEVKIYISELSTLNKKVYDQNYNLIGNVTDFGKDLTKTYGEQHYTTFEEEEAE